MGEQPDTILKFEQRLFTQAREAIEEQAGEGLSAIVKADIMAAIQSIPLESSESNAEQQWLSLSELYSYRFAAFSVPAAICSVVFALIADLQPTFGSEVWILAGALM